MSTGSPNLMDADVPALVPVVYVGLNEDLDASAEERPGVSVISVDLLTKLKERHALRTKDISMVAGDIDDAMEVAKDGDADDMPAEAPVPSQVPFVNPSVAAVESDELDRLWRSGAEMESRLQEMARWREGRSGSSAIVRLPSATAPTQQAPQNGAEIARSAFTETLQDTVLVATPIDGGNPYIVERHRINTDRAVTYNEMEVREAIRRNLMEEPTFISDPGIAGLPIARAPDLNAEDQRRRSKREGKMPMRYRQEGDADEGSPVAGELEAPKTYEQRLAEALDLTLPAAVTIPEERAVEYPDYMKAKRSDSDDERREKHGMRRRLREEVKEHNDAVEMAKKLREIKEQNAILQLNFDMMQYMRTHGTYPLPGVVVYYVIYQPFLKDVLTGPPYNYTFDDADIQKLIDEADALKSNFIEMMDDENSIKSILASAMIKINAIEIKSYRDDTDNDILEALNNIIERYTIGQEELLRMQDSSSGYYKRGVTQSNAAKQTKEGLDSGPQIKVMKRLKETLAQGSAGLSQAGADTYVVKVFDSGTGVKNPYIDKCNDLYDRYFSPTVSAVEQREIKVDYDKQYELYQSKEQDINEEKRILKLVVVETSAKQKDARDKAFELQTQLNEKVEESSEVQYAVDEDEENEEEFAQMEYERAAVVDPRYKWDRTPNEAKMQIFPPDGTLPDRDTAVEKRARHEALDKLLNERNDRKKRLAELSTECVALQNQISQIKYAEFDANYAKKAAGAKLRYAKQKRFELTDEQRLKNNERASKRRKEKAAEVEAAEGDGVQLALAVWQKKTNKSRERVEKDVENAKDVLPKLKLAKDAFEQEKERKRKQKEDLNIADEQRSSNLTQQILSKKKALGRSAKDKLIVKFWDAALGDDSLNQKNKERKDAIKEMEVEVSRARSKFDDCITVAKANGLKRQTLRPLYEKIKEYQNTLAANHNKRSQASDDLETLITEAVPETVSLQQFVQQYVQEYEALDALVRSQLEECKELNENRKQTNAAKASKQAAMASSIGRILEELFKERQGSDSSRNITLTDDDKRDVMEVVDMMVEQQEIQFNIVERNSIYKKDFDQNYAVRKSTEKLKVSASNSARDYARLFIEVRQTRERIESNMNLVVQREEVEEDFVQDVLSVFEGAKRESFETHLRAAITTARKSKSSEHATLMHENLALKLTRSNRSNPYKDLKSIVDQSKKEIDQYLQDAVSGRGFTLESETKMRMAEYQDAIDDIIRFAQAGSPRALHFYSMVCWYAINLSRVQDADDKSKLLATFSGDIRNCDEPPSDARSLTIYWENVEKYKAPEVWRDLGAELIHVIVQWTRIPMERRAGSVPSREQLQTWLDARIISSGADSSEPVIEQITGELMVVTSEDRRYNKLRGISWDVRSGSYSMPASFGDDQRSEPLGPIKRTPVSWVTLNRGLTLNVHVPINDEFNIVRRSPSNPHRALWPLHLTQQEALQEYLAADEGPVPGKDVRVNAAFKTSQKWRRSPSDNGMNYPEFDPSDFTPAFWDAVETSRDNHTRLVEDYKTFSDEITKLQQKMQELQTTAENAKASGMSTKTVSSLAQEAGVSVEDGVKTADASDSSLLNLSSMQGTTGAVVETYRTLKILELAKALLEYRMAADFGIPRTGYTRFDENRRQLFQSMLEYRTKFQSFVDESSVLDRGVKAPRAGTENDGVNASAQKRMWLDNKEQVKQAVALFNQFLKKYYPWETPLAVDDEVRLLQFLNWMRKLRAHNFTHVVLLVESDTNMKMWVCGVDGGGASQRVLGPGFTTSIQGFSDSSSDDRRNQSRWFTYAKGWSSNTADRVDKFETSVGETYEYNEDERQTDLITRIRAMVAEGASGVERERIVERGANLKVEATRKQSNNGITSRSQDALLMLLNTNALPSVEDRLKRQIFDAFTGQMRELSSAEYQDRLENDAFGANPSITIALEGDGAVEPQKLNVRLFDIQPRHMRLVIKAMKRDRPGEYSTCMRYVWVDGGTRQKAVGSIIRNNFMPTSELKDNTRYVLKAQSQRLGAPEFEEWLNEELEGAQGLQALAAPSGAASSSYAPPLPPPPGNPNDSDADMLALPAPSSGDDGAGPSQPDPPSAEEAERRRRELDYMWDDAMQEAGEGPSGAQPTEVRSDFDDSDDSDDSDDEPANANPRQDMDMTAAIEDEGRVVEETDLYIAVMKSTRIPELDSDTLNSILRMYDPGPLRRPTSYCGAPIRPVPLPDFEVEVA